MNTSDRHATVERDCENCGKKFTARVERVNNGQGRFCSLKCFNKKQREDAKSLYGFEKGKKYWDGYKWTVHWYDNKGNVHATSYPKWWWTVNKGKVPKGFCVSYKDENPSNINPRNFFLISRIDLSARTGARSAGIPKPSIARENNKWWKGGSSYEGYPTEFSKPLKKRVKIRDDYTCQCCYSKLLSFALDVHHIDTNREHNSEDNLVTVCKSCHKAIHGKMYKMNAGIKKYQELLPA